VINIVFNLGTRFLLKERSSRATSSLGGRGFHWNPFCFVSRNPCRSIPRDAKARVSGEIRKIAGPSPRAVRFALSSQMILKLPISRTSDAAARMRHRVAASTELRRGVLLTPALLPREGALRFVHRFMKGVYLLQAADSTDRELG
jgi:hypothetical protein